MKRPKGPSARCPKCRKRVAIRKSDGLFRLHGYMPGDDSSAACPGSGKADPTPAPDTRGAAGWSDAEQTARSTTTSGTEKTATSTVPSRTNGVP